MFFKTERSGMHCSAFKRKKKKPRKTIWALKDVLRKQKKKRSCLVLSFSDSIEKRRNINKLRGPPAFSGIILSQGKCRARRVPLLSAVHRLKVGG